MWIDHVQVDPNINIGQIGSVLFLLGAFLYNWGRQESKTSALMTAVKNLTASQESVRVRVESIEVKTAILEATVNMHIRKE